MKQSALPFVFPPSYRSEDFIVSPANAQAHAWITGWPHAWPQPALVLYGAAGSGKTHLAHLWQELSGAQWLDTAQIGTCPPSNLLAAAPAWIAEEPVFAGKETAWFHLINTLREEGKWLLITSSSPLSAQNISLPDLASRIGALPATCLQAPDDLLLTAQLSKRFSDIQLRVAPEVVQYLVSRMERDFLSTEKIVNKLDSLSLAEKRNITLPLVRKILETQ